MDTSFLKIIQVNLGRGRIATAEALELAKVKQVPILLIQEPYSVCFRASGLGTYTNQIISGNRDDEPPWACIVILDREYSATILRDVSTSHCVCAYVSGPFGGFYVISAYLQYSLPVETVLQQVHRALSRVGNSRVIVGMDANAVSPLWSWREGILGDQRGDAVEGLLSQWNLVSLNREGELCTYRTGERDIDVTVTNHWLAGKLISWKVLDDVPSTDHRPIMFSFGNLPLSPRIINMRYNLAKADWESFCGRVSECSAKLCADGIVLNCSEDVQRLSQEVEDIIVDAGNAAIRRKTNFLRSVPWWNRKLTGLKRETNRLRRIYQAEKDEEQREIKRLRYKECRKRYTRESLKAKKDSWKKFVQENSAENPYGIVYKMARQKMNCKSPLVAVLSEDCYTSDWKQTAGAILEGLFGSPAEECERQRVEIETSMQKFELWDEIDIIKAVKSMRNGKSPGRDLIEVEMVKRALGAGLLPLLMDLYNGCARFGVFPKIWKTGIVRVLLKSPTKDPTQVRSYRPVCLLPVLSKVLERLIKNSISHVILHPTYSSPQQYGFRAKRSTEDAISCMRRALVETDKKMSLAILFDITGAFDNLKWDSILNELRRRGTNDQIFNLISDYLFEREVRVEENYESVTKRLHKGCPQGSIVGPDFWNICVDKLLIRLTKSGVVVVAYADDLVVIVYGNSRRELEVNAAVAVNIIYNWSLEEGLQLSKDKTEMIMLRDAGMGKQPGKQVGTKGYKKKLKGGSVKGSLVSTGKGGRRPPIIKLGEKSIRYSPNVKYLGVKFGTRLSIITHVREVISRGKLLFNKLGVVARANWGLNFSCLRTLYTGVFVPMLLYAIGSWGDLLRLDNLKILLSAQRQALLRITRAYRTTSTIALQVLSGVLPLDILAVECIYRYKVRVGEPFVIEGFSFNNDIRRSEANKRLHMISLEKWQKRWEQSTKGRLTAEFFPSVRERINNRHFSTDYRTVQFLTGHGDFNYKLNYFHLVDDVKCKCGEPEDSRHVLVSCPLYEKQRHNLVVKCIEKFRVWPTEMANIVRDKELWYLFTITCREIIVCKKEMYEAVEVRLQ